eukprot:s1804_g12.t1
MVAKASMSAAEALLPDSCSSPGRLSSEGVGAEARRAEARTAPSAAEGAQASESEIGMKEPISGGAGASLCLDPRAHVFKKRMRCVAGLRQAYKGVFQEEFLIACASMSPKKDAEAKAKAKGGAKAAPGRARAGPVGGLPPPALHKNTSAMILEAQEQVKRILDHDAFEGVLDEMPPQVGSNQFSAQDNLSS